MCGRCWRRMAASWRRSSRVLTSNPSGWRRKIRSYDPQLVRRSTLFPFTRGGQLAWPQVGIAAALVAAGEQHIGEMLAGLRPFDNGPGAAELRVIGMRADHHHAVTRFGWLSHERSPRPAPASRRSRPCRLRARNPSRWAIAGDTVVELLPVD